MIGNKTSEEICSLVNLEGWPIYVFTAALSPPPRATACAWIHREGCYTPTPTGLETVKTTIDSAASI